MHKEIDVMRTVAVAAVLALAGCDDSTNAAPDAGIEAGATAEAGTDAEADWYWPKVPDAAPLKKIGEPCTSNKDCADQICVSVAGQGLLCSRICYAPAGCPSGFYCAEGAGPLGNKLCLPGSPPPPCVKPDAGPPADSGATDGGAAGGLTKTAIGTPVWDVIDMQFIAAPVGTQATNWAEGLVSAKKVLSSHIFYTSSCYGFGPDASKCHSPAGELAARASAAGFALSGFTTSDLVAPSGIHFMLTLTAKDSWGPSPCSSCEPVVPDTLFPIAFDGDLYRDGQLVDPDFDDYFCSLNQLAPMFAGKSFDHLHLSFMESSEYITPAAGTYELKFKLTDAQGKGWNVSKTFVVTGGAADAGVSDGPVGD